MPPSFDDKMTKNALNIIRWAAVFYLFFGYWNEAIKLFSKTSGLMSQALQIR